MCFECSTYFIFCLRICMRTSLCVCSYWYIRTTSLSKKYGFFWKLAKNNLYAVGQGDHQAHNVHTHAHTPTHRTHTHTHTHTQTHKHTHTRTHTHWHTLTRYFFYKGKNSVAGRLSITGCSRTHTHTQTHTYTHTYTTRFSFYTAAHC